MQERYQKQMAAFESTSGSATARTSEQPAAEPALRGSFASASSGSDYAAAAPLAAAGGSGGLWWSAPLTAAASAPGGPVLDSSVSASVLSSGSAGSAGAGAGAAALTMNGNDFVRRAATNSFVDFEGLTMTAEDRRMVRQRVCCVPMHAVCRFCLVCVVQLLLSLADNKRATSLSMGHNELTMSDLVQLARCAPCIVAFRPVCADAVACVDCRRALRRNRTLHALFLGHTPAGSWTPRVFEAMEEALKVGRELSSSCC